MKVLKLVFRDLIYNRRVSIINMLGLIPALVCSIILLVWMKGEFSVDDFYHSDSDIIVLQGYHEGQQKFWGAPPAVGPVISAENPEIIAFSRFQDISYLVKYEDILSRISSNYID